VKKYLAGLLVLVASVLLVGCGGGEGSSSASSPTVSLVTETGTFVDAPVEGLGYSTPTMSGYTDSQGQFQYKTGEMVTFNIGNLVLGTTVGGKLITPLTLTGESNLSNISVKATNIARLLQSLDVNTTNLGSIEIPTALHDLNVSNINLENETDLNTVLTIAQTITTSPYVLKDSISARDEMKKGIQLYEKYPSLQSGTYTGIDGSTAYYLLNMTSSGNVVFDSSYNTSMDLFDTNLSPINLHAGYTSTNFLEKGKATALQAGTYIVKVNYDDSYTSNTGSIASISVNY